MEGLGTGDSFARFYDIASIFPHYVTGKIAYRYVR